MTTPDSDIVERLRNENWLWTVPGALRKEAADEIERLRAYLRSNVVGAEDIINNPKRYSGKFK